MFSSHMMKTPVICGPESLVYRALLAPLRLSVRTKFTLWCRRTQHQLPSSTTFQPSSARTSCLFLIASSPLNIFLFCESSNRVQNSHSTCFLFFSFLHFPQWSWPFIAMCFFNLFHLSVNHMFASLKFMYNTVCVYWWKKCHLICKTNYNSLMAWTTPLMTVNDRVVMWRCELAVSQLNLSLLFIIALLLWRLTGYFGLLEANVILISYEGKQRAWNLTVSTFFYFSLYNYPSVWLIIIIFIAVVARHMV